ncbi:MAG: WecB/TagA/CpsF family glycosyltransferase [Pseudomonadota bacterium]
MHSSRRLMLFGCPIDSVTMQQATVLAERSMRLGQPMRHVALNAAKLVGMRENQALFDDVAGANLITADGMGIVLLSHACGSPLPERVTGIDLMIALVEVCAKRGYRPFFLGAEDDVLCRAVFNLQEQHNDLIFAGWRNGYFSRSQEDDIVRDINNSRADCLFVGLPTPMKEDFMARNAHRLQVPFVMGVGGSFDVLAGKVRRAPAMMQRMGMEWAWRLGQEPGRMWHRYLVSNARLAVLLGHALVQRATRRGVRPAPRHSA